MPIFAGLDVAQAKTTVCIVDERRLVTWRGSCATSPETIARTLATAPARAGRTGKRPADAWLVHELRALELPVVVPGRASRPACPALRQWRSGHDQDHESFGWLYLGVVSTGTQKVVGHDVGLQAGVVALAGGSTAP